MAKRKLEIKATEEQLEELYKTLKAGAPLQLALQRVKISIATYYYWVAVSSIVVYCKTQEEIEEMEALANSGVSVQNVRDLAAAAQRGQKTGIGVYIEPSQKSVLQYKNNRKFAKFADRVHEIVSECDSIRSEFATIQLAKVARSTDKKNNINPSGAMWWLERNLPDFYAKPSDRVKDEETAAVAGIPAVEVEFIDPETTSSVQRLSDMEEQILKDLKGTGAA